ncbi:MAG TPA: cation diffusion facilitator family transporter [Synergistaceae bacterium]|jgi:cation diffusion facilitator family transporter|nr:cation diffusion facilitator family transporter [Synergistaceae bacterium]
MIDFLIGRFVKDSRNISDPSVRRSYGAFAGAVGIIVNLALSLAKISAGTLFGSISVTADGINNLSDSGSAVVTLIGFKLSGKPADRDHPFGHERIEYLTGFILGIVILLVGVELIKMSVSRIIDPRPTLTSDLMIAILIISVAVKLWLAKFYSRVAELISSSAVKAASADSMNDVLTTSAVLCGLLVSRYFGYQIDGWMGMGVALFILRSGIMILKSLLGPILGEMPDPELVEKIERKVRSYKGIINVHDLVVHRYGPNVIFATVHAEVDAKGSFISSHDLIDCIERDCAREMNINLVIHLDPVITDDKEINGLKKMTEDIVRSVEPTLSIHDFRVVKGDTHTNLIFDVLIPADYDISDSKAIEKIERAIKEKDPAFFPVITIDRNYASTYINEVGSE